MDSLLVLLTLFAAGFIYLIVRKAKNEQAEVGKEIRQELGVERPGSKSVIESSRAVDLAQCRMLREIAEHVKQIAPSFSNPYDEKLIDFAKRIYIVLEDARLFKLSGVALSDARKQLEKEAKLLFKNAEQEKLGTILK